MRALRAFAFGLAFGLAFAGVISRADAAEDAGVASELPESGAPAPPPPDAGASTASVDLSSLSPRPPAKDGEKPLEKNRQEFIVVPDIGGSSDTGAEIGVAVTVVRFREGFYPYRWRFDAVGETSFKNDLRGFRLVQQYHVLRLDMPHFLSPRLRLDNRLNFLRAVNSTWFGTGNDSRIVNRPAPLDAASPYEYIAEHVRLRSVLRIKTDTPGLDVAVATNLRYEFPDPFPASKLSDDIASRAIVGSKPSFLETVAVGLMVDTRDNEFYPRHGVFYQVGIAETVGTNESVVYGEASANLAHYAELSPWLVFASRMLASFQFGNVPFYEQQQGGVFNPHYLLGGDHGVRGVRWGRYAGLVKAIANNELRATPFPRFKVLGYRFMAGMNGFFDAGRVWSDYTYDPVRDGRKVSIKWGTGGGVFFQWDEAALFRIDVAWSPDPVELNASKVSVYIESGFAF